MLILYKGGKDMLDKVILYNELFELMRGSSDVIHRDIVESFDNFVDKRAYFNRGCEDLNEVAREVEVVTGGSIEILVSEHSSAPLVGITVPTNGSAVHGIVYSVLKPADTILYVGTDGKLVECATRDMKDIKKLKETVDPVVEGVRQNFSKINDFYVMESDDYKKRVSGKLNMNFEQRVPIECVVLESGDTLNQSGGDVVVGKIKKPIMAVSETYNPIMFMSAKDRGISQFNLIRNTKMNHIMETQYFLVDESIKSASRAVARSGRAITRAVGKGVTNAVGGALKLPVGMAKKIMDMITRGRNLIGRMRDAKDERLKERLFNNEFIPFFDDVFAYIIPAIVTYGLIIGTMLNPLVAILIGLIGMVTLKWNADNNKKRVTEILDDKIKLLDEEIEDAKMENDLATKKKLMQLKMQLERQRAKIRTQGSITIAAK